MSVSNDIEQARKYIDNIDFSMIIHKMVKEKGWLQRDAEELSRQYRRFLFLQKKYGFESKLPPSEEIDEFWHNHILDTRKYREDCQMIFGHYFDHYPYFGIDDKTDYRDLEIAFNRLLKLYFTEYGEHLYEVRTWHSKLAGFIKLKFRSKPRRGEQNGVQEFQSEES